MKFELFTGKDKEELKNDALKKLNITEQDCLLSYTTNKAGLFKGETYNLKIYLLSNVADAIKDYLAELLNNMSIDVSFEVKIRNQQINIKMFSDKNNILIGKNGQTLQALQILIRQHIYREVGAYPYILLDVENYKEKQQKNLEYLAQKLAHEVIQTKQMVTMDNMNSYERRIVHNVLSKFDNITTQSEGDEPNRHIVIKIKED